MEQCIILVELRDMSNQTVHSRILYIDIIISKKPKIEQVICEPKSWKLT